jgi:glycosyltransferase involved in cell wall biosynthesis
MGLQVDQLIRQNTVEVSDNSISRQPKASVRIITHNHAHFIAEALDSVLVQQVDFPLEIVVGEDCSSDGTTQIVLDYQKRHPDRIRVLLAKENLGKHTGNGRLNLIRTLEACRGEYIALLDGDDYWTNPQKLQKQIGFLESHPSYSASCHQTQLINADGSLGKVYGAFNKMDLQVTDTIATRSPWHTSSFVFRRRCFKLPVWFCNVVSADMATFTIVASKGPIRAFPEVMSVYRKHPGGITETDYVTSTFYQKRIELMEYLDHYLAERFHDQIEAVKAHHRAALNSQSGLLRPLSLQRRLRRSLRSLGSKSVSLLTGKHFQRQ